MGARSGSVVPDPRRVVLRETRDVDLDFVLALERNPENALFVGRWSREEHRRAIEARDREHWLIEVAGPPRAAGGFLVAYDLRSLERGVYIKRVVVQKKRRGLGQAALSRFLRHAFEELGAGHAWLAVSPKNARAIRAYLALGFRARQPSDTERARCEAVVGELPEAGLLMFLSAPPRDRTAPATRTKEIHQDSGAGSSST